MQSKSFLFFLLGALFIGAMKPRKEPTATLPGNMQKTAFDVKKRVPVFNYPNEFEAVRNSSIAKLKSLPWHAVSKKYIQELEQQEDALWQRFFALTTLKKDDIASLIKKNEKEYFAYDAEQMKKIKEENKDQLVPAALEKHIQQLAYLFSIEPSKLKLILDPSDNQVFRVGRTAIYVNDDILHFYDDKRFPSSLYTFSEPHIISLLVHEMWHILYQDRYLEWLGKNVFNKFLKKPEDAQAYENLLLDFHHFVEYRADVLTGLWGIKYISGLISFSKTVMKTQEKNQEIIDDPLHPSYENRIKYLNGMYQAIIDSLESGPITAPQ